MASMFNQNRFGAHGDVMGAAPEDDAGKASLCEEIKGRARAEFGRKNLPQAEMLYSKGLQIMPEDATLHSNLAAVRLGLNKPQPALENANEALRLDPAYAKGHYRRGQALMALSRPAEAADAFRAGAALDPSNKLWPPLVEKAVKAAEAAPVAAKTDSSGHAVSSPATVSGGRASTSPGTSARNAAPANGSNASGQGVVERSGGGDGSAEGSDMKGYKKTADGRTTTYFNNDLSEEARALIGDIAPKKLEATAAAGDEGGSNEVSAWNKAGTWESRDMTSWAKQRLHELVDGVQFDAPEGSVRVIKIENLEGDAEISFSRGRKRYMFDFRFELKWEVKGLEAGPAKGVLVYPDVGQDCDEVYDVDCRVDSSSPPAAKGFVDLHVRAEGSGLRQAVQVRLAAFSTEFNAK